MPFKAGQFWWWWWALHLALPCNSLSQVEGDFDYASPAYDTQMDDTQTDDTQTDVDTQMDGTPASIYDTQMNEDYGGNNGDTEDYPGSTPETVSM